MKTSTDTPDFRTAEFGTWPTAVGAPCLLAAVAYCWFVANRPDLAVMLLVPAATMLVFIAVRWRMGGARLILRLHTASLSAIMMAGSGVAYVLMTDEGAGPSSEYAGAIAVVLATVATYRFSAGARRSVPYVVGAPIVAMLIGFFIGGPHSPTAMALLWTPVSVAVGVSLSAISVERRRHREIPVTSLAVCRESELLKEEVGRRYKLEEQLRILATRDDLTGVLNRRAGLALLEDYIETADQRLQPLSLVFLDVDHLKTTNDQYGQAVGDEALKRLARTIRRQIRASDYVSRVGGDEFIVAFENCEQHHAIEVIERVRRGLKDERDGVGLEFSYGCFEYRPGSALTADEIVRVTDARMYEVKQNRGGT